MAVCPMSKIINIQTRLNRVLKYFFKQKSSVIFVCSFFGALQDNFGALTVPQIKKGLDKMKFQVLKLCMFEMLI